MIAFTLFSAKDYCRAVISRNRQNGIEWVEPVAHLIS